MEPLGFPEDHVYPNNAGVRAFRTHRSDLLEAFTNQKVSFEFAALLSDETRKIISGLKRTKQKVSEFLDEIEISLRLHMTFHWFVENLRKENTENSSVQQLCDELLSTCASMTGPDMMLPIPIIPSGPVDLSRVPDGTLDSSHLSVLVTALSRVHRHWLPLGIYLGVNDSTLIEIHRRNQKGNDETRGSEMLAMWLQGPKKKRNKQFLQSCLQRPLIPPWSSAPSTSTACGDEVPTRKKQEKARKFSVRADYDDEALPRRKFEKHSKQAACKDEVPSKKKQKRGSKQGHLPRELTRCTAEVIRKGAQVTCKVTSELSRPQSPVGRIVSREIPIEVTVRMDQSQTNELVLQKYKQHVNRYYKDTRVQFTNVTNSHEQLDHDEQSSSVINSMQAFVTINNEGFPEDHVYPNNGGVRAFRTHYDELLEAFTNQKVSFKFAALLSDETRKMILGLKRTKQKVSELLDEIEISLRLNMTFHCFVENLRKENEDNSSVQQLCDKLLSTCARISQGPDLMLPVSTVPSGPVDLSRVADGTLDSSHLSVLVTALSRVHHQWLPLGIYLGLSDSTLIEIFIRNQKGNDETRVSEMLAMWLQGPKKKRNKKFLQTCLRRPLTPPWSSAPSAPNTSNPREYICQVFYKQDGINSWIAVFSFFPKDFLEEVKNHYFAQYTEVGPTVDLQLKSKQIKILSTGKVNGWSCEFSDHDHQVSRKDVEQYTGVGKPPYCEMTLRADADGSTPPDLTLPVTLTGVKQSTTIILERMAQQSYEDIWKESSLSSEQETDTYDSTKYMCQVFYHKEGTNHWTVTVTFLPSSKQRLQEQSITSFYQNAITGPVTDFQFKKGSNASVKVGVDRKTALLGWAVVNDPQHNMITRAAVDEYASLDHHTTVKPPCCVMTFQPRYKGSIPPDLSVSLTLTGGKLLQPITLERKAEAPSSDFSSDSSQDSEFQDSDFQEKPHEQEQSQEKFHKEASAESTSDPQKDYIDPDVAKTSLGVRVEMEITNVGTQGYPGVGKTSVLDLAMGKEPAPTRTSTDCVDPPSRYLMIDSTAEGVEWEKVTIDKMFELVCEAMKKTIEDNPPDIAESDIPTATASQSISDKNAILVANDLKWVRPLASNSNRSSLDSVPVSFPAPSLNSTSDPYPISCLDYSGSMFPELLKKLSSSKSSGVIFNSHWMMVTDCGGQPPFLDAAALFLRNSCLQIFPVKLNEPLKKTPEFSYFFNGSCVLFDEPMLLTHQQIIETLAKSVASIQPPYTPSATKCPKGAKFTIVGTFKDEAYKCSETVEEKESILEEVLEPYESFQVQLGKKVILPVNAATIDTKERTESAKKLRRLFKKSDVSMKIDMKLRWFGLLLSILTIAEKEHKAVLTLDKCYKLGDSLGMDKSETRKAIHFFHDISIIMHFDTQKLRDSVIINTKPVLNKLSRLISVSFLDENFLADHYDIELPHGAKYLLQYRGRFRRDTLEKCAKFTEPITLQFFLDILEHVKIAVAIDKESEYFIPCALSYDSKASVPESSPPWVIRLRVRRGVDKEYIPIPVGYLPAVVVFLLTEFSSLFSTDRCKRQYRNKIVLEYEHGGFIFLVERHLQLEVHYSGLDEQCATIRVHVLESIRLTEEKLHLIQEGEGTITKVDSFLCSCDKDSAHFCTYKPSSGRVQCEKTGKLYELDPQHLLWLGNKGRLVSAGNIPESSHTSSASCQQEQAPMEAPPEATSESEIVQESSHTNSASGTTQQEQQKTEGTHVQVASESSNTLDIDKMVEVKDTLNRVNDWQSLGLQLGLLYPTLEKIETDNHGKVEQCKTKMIAAWLKRQDNVLQVGVPSWSVLKKALRKIGEGEVANQIVT